MFSDLCGVLWWCGGGVGGVGGGGDGIGGGGLGGGERGYDIFDP